MKFLQEERLPKHFWQKMPWSYMLAAAGIASMTIFIRVVHADASEASVPMLYLLIVTIVALFCGRSAAILAAVTAFISFDWFFVKPRYQFAVQNPTEWIALCVFLLTAIVIGQLTALLRLRAEEAQRLKLETQALAEASWAVASELDRNQSLYKILQQLVQIVPLQTAVLFVLEEKSYKIAAQYQETNQAIDSAFVVGNDTLQFVFNNGKSIGWDDSPHWQKALNLAQEPVGIYMPILLENQVLGVLYFKLNNIQQISANERQLVQSLLNHAAVILQRDKLMKAKAKVEALAEADRLKTALLSMVSHDFRSPLTSIKASVSSLMTEGIPLDQDVQYGLLQAIDQETDRLNRMVGNILDLSRLETGAWRSRFEMSQIAEVIGSTLDSFSANDNKRIKINLDPRISDIYIDSVQIIQVLKNLLENALKYSSENTSIELTTACKNGSLIIEVSDRGAGLPKGEEAKVFEPFYRAPGLKETAISGVGIGLTLSRGLVEANGGQLTAYNREGGGAIFRVTLANNALSEQRS